MTSKLQDTASLSLSLVLLLSTQMLPVHAQSGGDLFTTREKTIAAQRQYAYEVLMEQAKDDCANNPGKAEACLTEARKIAEEQKLTLPLLNTLHLQGQLYTRIKEFDCALEAYDAAHKVFLKTISRYKAKRYYSYGPTAEMDDHVRMFKEYVSLLESQRKSTKTIKEVDSLIEDLTKSVEHAYKMEDAQKQRDKERLANRNLDVDFGPYMAQLHRKINSNWVPLRGDVTAGRVIALFKVQSNGSIEGVKLVTPSSSETADEACLRAIKASNPLLPLPDGAPKSIDVQFTFDAIDK